MVVVAFILLKKLIANFIINIKNDMLIFMIYSISIGFGIALMAGHVFTAPAVSIFLILAILEMFEILYYKRN